MKEIPSSSTCPFLSHLLPPDHPIYRKAIIKLRKEEYEPLKAGLVILQLCHANGKPPLLELNLGKTVDVLTAFDHVPSAVNS